METILSAVGTVTLFLVVCACLGVMAALLMGRDENER